ncbi:hypothetical protein CYLTODRAFT_352508 [Cylindrobasidium torrendii FP15055 ss-10]|uniref:YMC020W-like alpha/beta hydrolase domain-containing protein n=1 Tax=Cylindrobasidium torrendii FP15055 ss-10 TaxID=1314674 RepID=A0A0D7BB76_9AGAR|nr:hypothetical protein CYLTODRAFT_352508 [Cylindrobasidium torrendii FP15055 ss-10]
MSVLSSESHASWFTPWAWYAAPEPTATQSAPELRGTPVEDVMTPSERVREEALARETASTTVETAVSSTITETTVDNRSTWSSFFASVSRKSIPTPVKRDEDGNEIMDIDDEPPAPTPPKSPAPSQKLLEAPSTPALSIKDVKISKKAPAPQLVVSEDVKKQASSTKRKSSSSSPSPKDKKREKPAPPPQPPRAPNLVLPTWEDTFNHPPRAAPPKEPASISGRLSRFITGKGKSREETLPFVLEGSEAGWAKGCRRVVVFGIHGWFPGAIMRTMFGEPTGTSPKFVAMMEAALEDFQKKNDVRFEKVTGIPLEGEGTIGGRVERLYKALVDNEEWMKDLHEADAVLIATHSQGSVVSTHLLSRLIEEGHIMTALSARAMPDELVGVRKVQRVCCLALCGIHLGPLRYLSSSSLLSPYFQYLENQAARELFEFQNTDNEVSKAYVASLTKVLAHGTKMVYIASMDDQVVPIYSGIFATASHPLILRAMYIDGDAYHSSDFLSNLLVLLIRVMNAGLRESGLISLLSEATAGSLSGVGHSTAYEETATYSLAVDYLFKTTPGPLNVELQVEDFDAAQEQNDYEIPWALRDLIAEERVRHLFGGEIGVLRGMFSAWKPRTAVLRDVKRKLGPIQRLGSIGGQGKTQGKTNEGRTSPSKL